MEQIRGVMQFGDDLVMVDHNPMEVSMAEQELCPRCSSPLVIVIGNQRHCNACSLDYGVSKNPIADSIAERKRQGVHGWKRAEPK
jgi:hypothetical protein